MQGTILSVKPSPLKSPANMSSLPLMEKLGSGCIMIRTSNDEIDENVKAEDALRYLNLFNKAYSLSNSVKISMAADTPLVVEYEVEQLGALKFYLAPKITDAPA